MDVTIARQPRRPVSASLLILVLFLASSVLFAQNKDHKIDRELMATLSDEAGATASLFVRFDEKANTKAARGISNRVARIQFVAQALQSTAEGSQKGVRRYLRDQNVDFTPFWIDNSIYISEGTLALARALARMPKVLEIVPEAIFKVPEPKPEAESGTLGIEWGIDKINAPGVWNHPTDATKGSGIVVANNDTGVQYNHPAIVNQYRGNNGGGSFSHLCNWADPSNVCGGGPCDNHGHGTHTIGTMTGDDGGSNQIGVAPEAEWIACKGCESGSCSSFALSTCAQWFLNPGAGCVSPHIVNNSWGGGGGNPWYQSWVQSWRAAGIFPAFSIGNSGSSCNTAGSPGDLPESFGVGATDSSDIIAGFSSRGPSAYGETKPNVSAPGVGVRSSLPTNGYASWSGTSMACPHVAGAVALLWAADPTLVGNIDLTEQILEETATPLTTSQSCGGVSGGAIPNNTYGGGRINVLAALNWNGASNSPPTVTIDSPANGAPFPCGSPVNLTGSATDAEDDNGALTASIQWAEGGSQFDSGASASKTYNCPADVGIHTIQADVTDLGGLGDAATVDLEIYDPDSIAAPSNFQAAANGLDVTATWAHASNNQTGFQVQRKKVVKGKGKKNVTWENIVPTALANATSQVFSLAAGTYDCRVYAFNDNTGRSSDNSTLDRVETSDSGGVDPPPPPPPPPGDCGNNVCEPSLGEDCGSCALDCNGKLKGKPSSRFCCGDDVLCGDSRCSEGGWQCLL